jgi:hypothetical protein
MRRKFAQSWFTDQEAKKQVSDLLSQLTRRVCIEAKPSEIVFRPRVARQDADLVESRRNKALGTVAEYRASLDSNCGGVTHRNAKGVLRLKMPPAIARRRPDNGERTADCR